MSQLTGYKCDNCGRTAEGDDLAGWVILALKQPLPIEEDGSESAMNTLAGDYHSAACAAKAIEKAEAADEKAAKQKKEVKKT